MQVIFTDRFLNDYRDLNDIKKEKIQKMIKMLSSLADGQYQFQENFSESETTLKFISKFTGTKGLGRELRDATHCIESIPSLSQFLSTHNKQLKLRIDENEYNQFLSFFEKGFSRKMGMYFWLIILLVCCLIPLVSISILFIPVGKTITSFINVLSSISSSALLSPVKLLIFSLLVSLASAAAPTIFRRIFKKRAISVFSELENDIKEISDLLQQKNPELESSDIEVGIEKDGDIVLKERISNFYESNNILKFENLSEFDCKKIQSQDLRKYTCFRLSCLEPNTVKNILINIPQEINYISFGKMSEEAMKVASNVLAGISNGKTINLLSSLGVGIAASFLGALSEDNQTINKISLINYPDPTVLLFMNKKLFASLEFNDYKEIVGFVFKEYDSILNINTENLPQIVFANLKHAINKIIPKPDSFNSIMIESNNLILKGKSADSMRNLFSFEEEFTEDQNHVASCLIKKMLVPLSDEYLSSLLLSLPNTYKSYHMLLDRIADHICVYQKGKSWGKSIIKLNEIKGSYLMMNPSEDTKKTIRLLNNTQSNKIIEEIPQGISISHTRAGFWSNRIKDENLYPVEDTVDDEILKMKKFK